MEDPILRRRDRTPTITVRGDIAEGLQPPDVSAAVLQALQPIIAQLPAGHVCDLVQDQAGGGRALNRPVFSGRPQEIEKPPSGNWRGLFCGIGRRHARGRPQSTAPS